MPAATHNINGHLLADYRPFQTTDITLEGKDDEKKITLKIQKGQKVKRPHHNTNLEILDNFQEGKSTERAVAAEIIRYRRALRSHSDLLGKVIGKYLEAQDIAVRLKGVIEGEDDIGGACVLNFNMLQVP